MDSFDVVHIFLLRVARVTHVSNHVPGSHHTALLQPFRIGIILAQMGVIIISLMVKAADSDPPPAVFVPAQSLHISGLHGNNRRSHLPHHIMSQMGPGIAVASRRAEIIGIRIGKGCCNGGKSLQSVLSFPHHISFFVLLLQQKFSNHSAQNRLISFPIIGIGRKPFRFFLQHSLPGAKTLRRIFQICKGPAVKFSAISGGGTGQQADPVHMGITAVGIQIRFIGQLKRLTGNIEIHPPDIILLRLLFRLRHRHPRLFRLKRTGICFPAFLRFPCAPGLKLTRILESLFDFSGFMSLRKQILLSDGEQKNQ